MADEDVAPTLGERHSLIAHYGRSLWDRQRARIRESNRLKQLVRDGLAERWQASPLVLIEALKKVERAVGAALEKQVAGHPLASFSDRSPGLGYGGLGRILAVTGPLSRFPNVAKLWAYMGMHVVAGMAPKAEKGKRANWARQGRTVCHQIGDAIVKTNDGKYRELYDRRRATVLARPRLGPSGCPFGQEHRGLERRTDEATGWSRKTGEARIVSCVKRDEETGAETSAHVYADAIRVAVKELLKDLWVEWRRVIPPEGSHGEEGSQAAAPAPEAAPQAGGRRRRHASGRRRAA